MKLGKKLLIFLKFIEYLYNVPNLGFLPMKHVNVLLAIWSKFKAHTIKWTINNFLNPKFKKNILTSSGFFNLFKSDIYI